MVTLSLVVFVRKHKASGKKLIIKFSISLLRYPTLIAFYIYDLQSPHADYKHIMFLELVFSSVDFPHPCPDIEGYHIFIFFD
jgi:hypothetical protein